MQLDDETVRKMAWKECKRENTKLKQEIFELEADIATCKDLAKKLAGKLKARMMDDVKHSDRR